MNLFFIECKPPKDHIGFINIFPIKLKHPVLEPNMASGGSFPGPKWLSIILDYSRVTPTQISYVVCIYACDTPWNVTFHVLLLILFNSMSIQEEPVVVGLGAGALAVGISPFDVCALFCLLCVFCIWFFAICRVSIIIILLGFAFWSQICFFKCFLYVIIYSIFISNQKKHFVGLLVC